MLLVTGAVLAVGIAAAAARPGAHRSIPRPSQPATGGIAWEDCGDGYQCARLEVPRDYSHPHGATFNLALIRLRAGSDPPDRGALRQLRGPGGRPSTDPCHRRDLFGAVNDRFDIVGIDPRRGRGPTIRRLPREPGDGGSTATLRHPFNLDTDALIAKDRAYIERCKQLNGSVLRYISTKNTARDMDRVRAAMGDAKLNYFGFSYGTFLGSTYASLFPHRYRAVVLDGPVDVDGYANRPTENLQEQSAGFERALGRFFQACAADQSTCGFGGSDPADAFEQLVTSAYQDPLPACCGDPAVDGDDLLAGAVLGMYAKQLWPLLVDALQQADAETAGLQAARRAFYAATWTERTALGAIGTS
jgi:pimeloyl-ACP methyl ester carboxylesterase